MTWLEDEPFRGGYPSIEFLALSGVERMRAASKGFMPRPPISHLFGLMPQTSGVASSTFSMPASPWLQSSAGVFLGGTAALVADAPLGSAISLPLGPGQVVVTSDLTLNYLRPTAPRSERLIARGRPIEVGRRLGLSEAVIEDGAGEVVAHATSRCFIREFPVPERTELPTIEETHYDTPDPYLRELTTTVIPPEIWREKNFIEICELVNAGELPEPPFAVLFGMTDVNPKEGYFETTVPSSPWFTSPAGTIYGGFLAYFADSVLAGAMNTVLPTNSICAALDLKVNFLRPVMPDGKPLTAMANVVHKGRTLILAECQIVNVEGKVVVRASSSATIIEGHSWSAAVIDETPTTPEA